jgi:hypothetical protein
MVLKSDRQQGSRVREAEVPRHVVVALILSAISGTTVVAQTVDVRIDAAEANAVLSILDKRAAGIQPTPGDWARLWSSDGYTRLARRETGMGRTFTDSAFRAFVMSAELLNQRTALARTLQDWETADPAAAAARALRYLPGGARIRATIYPVIKPQDNSFVFEVTTNPAIFMYIDPTWPATRFENTLAHELHHIGYGTACAAESAADSPRALALRWLGAFGEGMAMLAAAGSAETHPHATSPAEDRARWDRDMDNAAADLPQLEQFFLEILDGKLSGDAVTQRGMTFFGVQGPWYTVGWRMAAVIERAFGRPRLISVMCDPVALLATYNEAATVLNTRGERQPRWTSSFLERLARR